ncbi:MAG TPA: DEAD/DEAH box helicase, partial [Myxococcota bacterium]|nr:DEAD/DEAH box helicase [Myxococcota bacterium]
DDGVVTLETADAALLATARLRSRDDVAVTWIGRPIRVHRARPAGLTLRMSSGGGWFGLDGQLKTDGGAIELSAALEALRAGSAFIPMKDGEWVELEDDLRQVLVAMGRALPTGKAGAVQAGPLHAPLLAEVERLGATIDGAAAWRQLIGRLKAASQLPIEVPPALAAPLRPYQEEGFRWMCRLSHWGAGAVLADDMGLGKTIQAIAWLLHHASSGPALVVCPTSVCGNWLAELERFAPSLERRLLHGDGRTGVLDGLGPGVVVITSFTIAVRDQDALAATSWGNLVIDEAHAIKNAWTQRTRAIHRLTAERRVALTGTPIENHTGELWAVLTAVSPGLLGSQETFRDRFVTPIEYDRDPEVRQSLARLIRPFVLRRLKRDVATELPERTEIVVKVGLTAGERALYDGLRLAAINALGERGTDEPQARMHVLAALTRLRRAACHPRLIDPALTLRSSKLTALYDLLDPLLESGHRALVFSQFTGLLDQVGDDLRARGVSFRRLDGATPAPRRAAEIAAFQAGEAPVFLLSLKAGGVGLNLTAADTVIHLDPWWNPAVEDQATDRAHRIGQTQPVTVYRLVARGTVEEKILAMHGEKRELATSLLEGTDTAGRLDTNELIALMQGAATGAWDDEALDEAATLEPAADAPPEAEPTGSNRGSPGRQRGSTAPIGQADGGAPRAAPKAAASMGAASKGAPAPATQPAAPKEQAAASKSA